MQERKMIFINNNINKTNKNYEKQTGKAGQDRTQGIHSIRQQANPGLQTQGDYIGSN